jgi:hypothetical protein
VFPQYPLAVLIGSNAPFLAGSIDPRRSDVWRITPSRLRIGPEQVIAFGEIARINLQGRFRSDGRHGRDAEEKSCPIPRHSRSYFAYVLPETFPITNGRRHVCKLFTLYFRQNVSSLGL